MLTRGLLLTVALGAALGVTGARADECGNLQVAGYTASRTVGPLRQRVMVTSAGERIEEEGGGGAIQIQTPRQRVLMNPAAKKAVIIPGGPPKPTGEQAKHLFQERAQVGGLTQVTLGFTTPQGAKDWTVKTLCRPDGIFVEKQIKTPKGMVTIRQSNIQVGAVPASALSVPADYQVSRK